MSERDKKRYVGNSSAVASRIDWLRRKLPDSTNRELTAMATGEVPADMNQALFEREEIRSQFIRDRNIRAEMAQQLLDQTETKRRQEFSSKIMKVRGKNQSWKRTHAQKRRYLGIDPRPVEPNSPPRRLFLSPALRQSTTEQRVSNEQRFQAALKRNQRSRHVITNIGALIFRGLGPKKPPGPDDDTQPVRVDSKPRNT